MSKATNVKRSVSLQRLKRYSAYKESGVEWLGEIPAHWKAQRLKYRATVNDDALSETTDSNFEIIYVDISSVDALAGIIKKETFAFEKAPSRARRIVRHGDVIVSTVRTYLRAIAPIEDPEPNLIVSTGFAVIRPRRLDTSFAAYALRAPYFVERVVADSVGVSYPAINASELACLPITFPKLTEQVAITGFLDRETAKIDTLVAKKERLIELLEEKRAALIKHAVIKGLDPSISMKDSGVEWLGGIPVDWDVVRLGRLAAIGNGSTPSRGKPEYWVDGSYPWLTSGKINKQLIFAADEFVTPTALRECHLPRVPAESLLVAITGEGQTRGRAALLKIESAISQHLAYVIPRGGKIRADYLRRVFQSHYDWLRKESSGAGSTRAALTCEFLRAMKLAIPPVAEQRSISAFLDRETARTDALISRVAAAIERLKELRTALISTAVTGKIDVRGEAA